MRKGFTIIEAVVAVAIFLVVISVMVVFQRSVLTNTKVLQSGLLVQTQARKTIQTFIAEVRSVTPSAGGAYPIEIAATSSFVFYANIDGDSAVERVRYFLGTTTPPSTFLKGVTKPTGIVYNLANENISTRVNAINASSTVPVFTYYDKNYNGTSSSTPLSEPVNIPDIRLIKMSLPVDPNQSRSPVFQTYSTQVMLRNLKDNF
ncbi:MAG: prepilin-type N-terminal cleavage/methylation domain-containing protein [Patescibacteria group bacterium]